MLPDFPKVKKTIIRRIGGMVNHRADQDPLLGVIPRFVQHEGDRTTIGREDGTEAVIDFKEPIEATAIMSTEDIREKGSSATLTAAKKIATDLTRGLARRVVKSLEEATDEIGNTVNAEGKPFSPDLYLEVLRKLELAFDGEGNWIQPQIATAPQHKEVIELVLKQAEQDSAFLAEREAIVKKQREEWRAREASRRLVD